MAKTAIVFGSTGLVGTALVNQLILSDLYSKIKLFVRSKTQITHPKVEVILIDFDDISAISNKMKGDDLYMCLGTTMAKAGSKKAFYKVDYTYTMDVATAAFQQGVKKVCLISSMGADQSSSIYYSKVKGQIEQDISHIGFESVQIVRPSLLLGDRSERRVGERVAVVLSKILGFVLVGPLAKYAPIHDHTVAKAMIVLMQNDDKGTYIHESKALQTLAL
ncbi:MAG: NAD(P)H-binding protein [Saprospiraceae bacterium]